jgi:hypothetical protein
MILHARSHWSHFKTATITVRAPGPEAETRTLARAVVRAVADLPGGGRTLLLAGRGQVPPALGPTRLILAPGRAAIPAQLAPIAAECLAPGDVVVVQARGQSVTLRAFRGPGA